MRVPALLALLEITTKRKPAVSLHTAPFCAECCCNWHKAVLLNRGSPPFCCCPVQGELGTLNKMSRG